MDWINKMAEILGKTRSFPLISAHLSRTTGRDVGENGGDWGGFGGDYHGFGGLLGGFGGATFSAGHWTGLRLGDGLDRGGRKVEW